MFLPPSSVSSSSADPLWTSPARRSLHERILESLRYLSDEVETRRVGSLGEAQAAGYVAGRLRRAEFTAAVQSFRVSTGAQFALAMVVMIGVIGSGIAVLVANVWALVLAAVLVVAALILLLAEVDGAQPLRRILPGKTSQSVVGGRAATGRNTRLRVIVLAPLDSPPPPALQRTGTLIVLTTLVLAGVAIVGALSITLPVWPLLAAACSLVLIGTVLWIIRRSVAPAPLAAIQGVGELTTLLMIAEELDQLKTVEVWMIAIGGSAAGNESIRALTERYPFSPHDTCVINLHDISAGQPCFVTREGVLREQRADRMLLALAGETDAADMLIDAGPQRLRVRTLSHVLISQGFRALTIASHHGGSRYTSPDATTIERCIRLVVGMIRSLDDA